ncbi:hypothetical protein FOZ63_023374, partial [Perkinsus olseni]
ADVICDAPLEDISLKVCFRTLRASSSLRWYEQELFAKISAAVLARLTESGGIFSDDRPDTRLLHLAPAIYHLALSAHISAELASAIMEEFQDTARVSKRLQQWAALLTTEGGGDERSAMRRLVGASTQMVWAAAAMRFISEEGMLPATIIKTVFEMLVDLADSEGMSSQKLGSLAAINDMYKFSSDLTFALREAELRREGPLRSRATEWLRGKLGASGASFTEAFADNELTGGYTVDIVIGDPSNKHGVLVAPRNACYRSHLDGRRDRAPMATQLNVAALKKLGWKVGIIYEAILEPAKSTQNLSDDAGMTSEPAVLIAIGAVTILAMNRGRKRHERSRLETADEMRSRCAAEKAAQDMLSHARGVKGGQGKIVLRGPAIVTRGRTPLRLHYFPTRNRAEVARLLLEISHEPYEAVCYFYQTFLNCRSQFPFGELPVLELSDGTMIVQQHTIVRYIADIARMNGGRSRVKQAKVDMLFEQLIDMFESHTFSWDALKKNYFKESVTDVRDYRERVWKSCAIKYDIVMELGNKLPSSNPITKKNPKSSMMRVTCQDIKKVANHFGYPIPELVDRLTFLYDYDLDEALGRRPVLHLSLILDGSPVTGEFVDAATLARERASDGRVTSLLFSVESDTILL